MNALVSVQLALAVVLLVGTGLMLSSLVRAMSNDIGADPAGMLMFDLRMPREETITPGGTYRGVGLWNVSPAPASMVERALERLEQLPGVEVGAATSPPLTPALPVAFLLEGQAPAPPDRPMQGASAARQTVGYRAITRGFFDAMEIPLLRGRDFDRRDTAQSPLVAVVNETFSNRYFPSEDAIGQRIRLDLVPDPQPRDIVGVVGDTLDDPMQQAPEPAVYVPHVQQPRQWPGPYWPVRAGMYFVVRTIGAPRSALPTITAAVAEVVPSIPVADATTVEDVLHGHVAETRTYSQLLGLFGAIAALLAATGVYGTMTYSVARRMRELGIRVALGCAGWRVARAVLRQMGFVLAAGLSIGLIGALALTRVLTSALFEVTATDVPTYLAVVALLTLIASLACVAPVYRAVNVDPAVVLRSE